MPESDPIDLQILALLQEDGRRPVTDIAQRVALSATAVKRRIERLEAAGVIAGYAARVDYAKLGWGLDAIAELRFVGTTKPDEMRRLLTAIPEVTAVYTTAGNQDVIALVRTRSVDHLRDVIHRLRATGAVVFTRTSVVLEAFTRDDWHPPAR